MSATVEKDKMRVMVVRMLCGAVAGAVVTGTFLAFVGRPLLDLKDFGVMLAVVAGLSYVLIGLMVGVGMAVPGVGVRMLNVEDADELREETPKLKSGVVVLVLTGLFLLLLAMAGTPLLSRELALGLAASCLAGIVAAGWLGARNYDEMTRRMGEQTASATLQAGMLMLGVWAALSQLGYVAWVGPLALISAFALLQLLASFVIIAKRGMLMPR
jgi:hypothetical protein